MLYRPTLGFAQQLFREKGSVGLSRIKEIDAMLDGRVHRLRGFGRVDVDSGLGLDSARKRQASVKINDQEN